MPIIKNRGAGYDGGTWYSVRCDCCRRTAFNEASKEDAIAAVRESDWAIVSSGGKPMRDYCPDCFRAAQDALDWRKKQIPEDLPFE